MGKTAAAITFVIDAEVYLITCTDEGINTRLREAIRQAKSGELEINELTSVQEFLNRN